MKYFTRSGYTVRISPHTAPIPQKPYGHSALTLPNLHIAMPPNNPQARLNTTRLFNVKSGGLLRRISIQYVQAITDFIAFCLAPLVAAGLLYSWQGSTQPYFPQKSLALLVTLHVGLGLVCTGWFWVRLRHYTYRKTFWAELGEILRTIAVLALVQIGRAHV